MLLRLVCGPGFIAAFTKRPRGRLGFWLILSFHEVKVTPTVATTAQSASLERMHVADSQHKMATGTNAVPDFGHAALASTAQPVMVNQHRHWNAPSKRINQRLHIADILAASPERG